MKVRVRTLLLAVAAVTRFASADDKADCLAASDKAQDLRSQSKLVESRAQLLICARDVCPGAISQDCTQWLKEVDAATPTITISAHDRDNHDLVDVSVRLDGIPWVEWLDGKAHPVNPGPHTFVFTAAGKPTVTQQVLVQEGDHDRGIVVVMGKAEVPSPTPDVTAHPEPKQPESPPASGAVWMRPVGYVLMTAGLVSVVAGGVFGIVATVNWNQATSACPIQSPCSDSSALNARSTAGTTADWSTALLVAGGVVAATGFVVWLAAPKTSTIRVGVTPQRRGAALSINGTF